jgi:hypothetical protein
MSLPVKSLLQSLVCGRAGALSFSVAWAALQEALWVETNASGCTGHPPTTE